MSEQSVYTNTEINKKLKENEDAEYAKLQNQLDEMVDYINNMNIW